MKRLLIVSISMLFICCFNDKHTLQTDNTLSEHIKDIIPMTHLSYIVGFMDGMNSLNKKDVRFSMMFYRIDEHGVRLLMKKRGVTNKDTVREIDSFFKTRGSTNK